MDAESLERSLGCVSDSNNTVTCKTSHYLQIEMSKCMVSFIDWYLLRINASEREKIKVRLSPAPVEPNYFQITQNIKCIQISWNAYFQSARHGDPHTHTIDNVDLDHEGLYTCVVGNGELANWRHRSILIWKVGKFPALAIVTNMSNYISEYSEQLRLI